MIIRFYFLPRWLMIFCFFIILLISLTGLGGCSTLGSVAKVISSSAAEAFDGGPSASYLDWKGMTVIAQPDANLNTPVAMDLVFVRDLATFEKLSVLPATRWFATRKDLQKTYPESFTVRSWELVPRQVLQLTDQEIGLPRVAGVLIFADYLSAGEHRAQLPNIRDSFIIDLGATDFMVITRPR